ncbi:hypothetical protein HMPREF9103_03116 [Lentilactobacillus parafarraginis F0439]|uniref:Uncharacterized protein n=1 Tax=Lentilactobacillus parafarraginis F0439 TaxID=797515 RepID=G9ZTN1_9LACO|nr:hypothetical protein [Lentilactobacillus parafarraginis]EHL95144.1 hypothetical protein HMPREF9103_03116 [Lentilactobacillus parafarraginis F0439]
MTLEELNCHAPDQKLVNQIYHTNDFDFVGLALQSEMAPHPIKWYFVAGN